MCLTGVRGNSKSEKHGLYLPRLTRQVTGFRKGGHMIDTVGTETTVGSPFKLFYIRKPTFQVLFKIHVVYKKTFGQVLW